MQEVPSAHAADVIVVNTCTVTHRSDQQVRQTIRRLHRENGAAGIVVTGCYAQRDPETLAAIPGVNLVVGNADRDGLTGILAADDLATQGRVIRSSFDQGRDFLVPGASHTGGKTRPLIKLQDGCDSRCSYCVVPAVRGPGRSADPADVLREVRGLVDRGYQEIVLTGVHLGTYGRKRSDSMSLVDLIADILEIPNLGRIRLSSIEPMRFSRGLARLASQSPAFAPHFHIPLQSGSDRLLRRMRRPYTAARFVALIEHIRSVVPDVGLGTDVIVGFPGESDSDFELTLRLLEAAPLSYLHVFPFSPRDGTDAWSMPGKVPAAVIRERARVLRDLSRQKNFAFRRKFLGQQLRAITLAKEEEQGERIALTGNYIHCRVSGPETAANRLVDISISRVEAGRTDAEITGEVRTAGRSIASERVPDRN